MLKEIGADMTSVYRSKRRKNKSKKELKEEETRKGNRGGKWREGKDEKSAGKTYIKEKGTKQRR